MAAVSVGIVDGRVLLDLPYSEDSRAEVDLNVVQTGSGRLVEVQGTAERGTFDRPQLDELLDSAREGHRRADAHPAAGAGLLRRILLATRNLGKVRELRELLVGLELELESLDAHPEVPEIEETGQTFEQNARAKASGSARASGIWAIAEDSGLVVDALGGAPGVFSARFAGRHGDDRANNAKLLRELAGESRREARYVCSLALAEAGGQVVATAEGRCEGSIAAAPRGGGGFGYDPLFLPALQPGRSMAELTLEQKNEISHRGEALRAFLPKIRVLFDGRDPRPRAG